MSRSEGIGDTDFISKVFKRHDVKQVLGGEVSELVVTMLSGAGLELRDGEQALDPAKLLADLETWVANADELKKRGFYVGFQAGSWRTPEQISDSEVESTVVACALVLSAARQLLLEPTIAQGAA